MTGIDTLFIYVIATTVSIVLICTINLLKREIREQRRFRRDFYELVAKYDFELATKFYQNKLSDIESNEISLRNGTRDQ